jgi:hypothetical protein
MQCKIVGRFFSCLCCFCFPLSFLACRETPESASTQTAAVSNQALTLVSYSKKNLNLETSNLCFYLVNDAASNQEKHVPKLKFPVLVRTFEAKLSERYYNEEQKPLTELNRNRAKKSKEIDILTSDLAACHNNTACAKKDELEASLETLKKEKEELNSNWKKEYLSWKSKEEFPFNVSSQILEEVRKSQNPVVIHKNFDDSLQKYAVSAVQELKDHHMNTTADNCPIITLPESR